MYFHIIVTADELIRGCRCGSAYFTHNESAAAGNWDGSCSRHAEREFTTLMKLAEVQ